MLVVEDDGGSGGGRIDKSSIPDPDSEISDKEGYTEIGILIGRILPGGMYPSDRMIGDGEREGSFPFPLVLIVG